MMAKDYHANDGKTNNESPAASCEVIEPHHLRYEASLEELTQKRLNGCQIIYYMPGATLLHERLRMFQHKIFSFLAS